MISEPGLLLVGFVLAHAAWNVSDLLKGELLCPFAIIEKDGKRSVNRFEYETQDGAIKAGKEFVATAQADSDAWAFVREGLFPVNNRKVDVLVIDFWAKGMKNPAMLIQEFEPYAKENKFRIIGAPIVVIDDKIQDSSNVESMIKIVNHGIKSHPKVADLWIGWKK